MLAALRTRIASGRPTDLGSDEPPPPASLAALARAEQVIGFPFPPLLRRIYAEVANGGIGPFGGVDGVDGVDGGHCANAPMLDLYVDYLGAELGPDEPPPRAGGSPAATCRSFHGCRNWRSTRSGGPR